MSKRSFIHPRLWYLGILVYLLTGVGQGCWVGSVSAQPLSSRAGAFATLDLSVRAAGMGGAYTAISNDGNAIRYNPAATAFVKYASLSATTTRLFRLVPATFIGVHYPTRYTSWLLGFEQIGDDLLRETTMAVAVAVRATDFLPANVLNLPGFRRMAFSATLKFRLASFGNDPAGGENRIQGQGRGYALDVGWLLNLSRIRVGLVLQELISQFRWQSSGRGSYEQSMVRKLRFGIAYAVPEIRMAVDFEPALYRDAADRIAVGLETQFMKWFVLRAGVAQNVGGLEQNKTYALGTGVYGQFRRSGFIAVQLGYRNNDLGNQWQVSLDLFWPGAR